MADGSHQFNFPPPQTSRLRDGEILVDLFAGGGVS
jgi:DNA (cytosine-5)-methyltransferase 1